MTDLEAEAAWLAADAAELECLCGVMYTRRSIISATHEQRWLASHPDKVSEWRVVMRCQDADCTADDVFWIHETDEGWFLGRY